MADLKISSLDVLAEAALYYSGNQENKPMNYPIGPKKLIQYRYEAQQSSAINSNVDFNGRLHSHSSGYASSSSPNHSSSSSPVLDSQLRISYSASSSDSTTLSEFNDLATITPKPNKITKKSSNATVNRSTAKKSRTKRKSTASASSTASSAIKDDAGFSQFVESVGITPKTTVDRKELDLIDDVFDENTKIQVKTPKLTYTLRGMRKRKPSTKTPDDLKDQEYYEKRHRNNLAGKRAFNEFMVHTAH